MPRRLGSPGWQSPARVGRRQLSAVNEVGFPASSTTREVQAAWLSSNQYSSSHATRSNAKSGLSTTTRPIPHSSNFSTRRYIESYVPVVTGVVAHRGLPEQFKGTPEVASSLSPTPMFYRTVSARSTRSTTFDRFSIAIPICRGSASACISMTFPTITHWPHLWWRGRSSSGNAKWRPGSSTLTSTPHSLSTDRDGGTVTRRLFGLTPLTWRATSRGTQILRTCRTKNAITVSTLPLSLPTGIATSRRTGSSFGSTAIDPATENDRKDARRSCD